MPGASTPAAKLASIQTAVNEIKSVSAQLSSVGSVNSAQALNDAAAAILQAAQGLSQDVAAATQAEYDAQAALAEAQAAAQAVTQAPPPAPGSTASANAPTDQTQVYVSAPAAGAMALVGLLVGTASGYAVKGYLDKRKLKAREEAQLTEGEEDE